MNCTLDPSAANSKWTCPQIVTPESLANLSLSQSPARCDSRAACESETLVSFVLGLSSFLPPCRMDWQLCKLKSAGGKYIHMMLNHIQ